jgi:hypothetical protein
VVIKGLHDQEQVDNIMGGKNEISNERIAITMNTPDGKEDENIIEKILDKSPAPVVEITPDPPKPAGKFEKIAEEDKW